jgi:hypothetical protein
VQPDLQPSAIEQQCGAYNVKMALKTTPLAPCAPKKYKIAGATIDSTVVRLDDTLCTLFSPYVQIRTIATQAAKG